MIETKTMFGVAAVGVSVVVGYGLYKYVRGKQDAQKIKEAIDDMVWFQNLWFKLMAPALFVAYPVLFQAWNWFLLPLN